MNGLKLITIPENVSFQRHFFPVLFIIKDLVLYLEILEQCFLICIKIDKIYGFQSVIFNSLFF